MLRGYDPLKETCQWSLIILFLLSGATLICVAVIPLWNSVSFLAFHIWNIPVGIILVLFLLLLSVIRLPFTVRRYWREGRMRDRLRRGALLGSKQQLTPMQPPTSFALTSLPVRLESRLKTRFVRWICIGAAATIGLLAIDDIIYLGDFLRVPELVGFPLYLMSIFVLVVVSWVDNAIENCVIGNYLLPALRVDDEGISACYGRETISIAWGDVRYFALVNSSAVGRIPRTTLDFRASELEAFEISDGENRICWLVALPVSSRQLLWFGGKILSAHQYSAFTHQLASLIVKKTDCPLLDFRLPQRGRPKKQAQLHAFVARA